MIKHWIKEICWYCDDKLEDLHNVCPDLPIYFSILAIIFSILAFMR